MNIIERNKNDFLPFLVNSAHYLTYKLVHRKSFYSYRKQVIIKEINLMDD